MFHEQNAPKMSAQLCVRANVEFSYVFLNFFYPSGSAYMYISFSSLLAHNIYTRHSLCTAIPAGAQKGKFDTIFLST
jgi:hypothetical protein